METPDKEQLKRERRAEFYALPDEALVDRETVAAVRYIEVQTVELEAIRGGGIQYRRVGRRALYRKSDVLDWMNRGKVVSNTAQLQGAGA